MFNYRMVALLCASVVLVIGASLTRAQTIATRGNLDCNGFSQVQRPLKQYIPCADVFSVTEHERGYDNGHYIGHDEPSIGFISTEHNSGNNVQWDITLPVERKLPAVQSFETFPTFWFSMALCDPRSFPNGPCKPDSDENTPAQAGSALLELQLYPPGFVTGISCDLAHWCAAMTIDSVEVTSSGQTNPNCMEPVNFAFIQKNGIPTGPPGPSTATDATFTPNSHTLLMNPGDHLRITIKDTSAGLFAGIHDLTTGQRGLMVASAANGFQNTDPETCKGFSHTFRPEFETARFGNFVPWAVLQANVNFSMEIGHFEVGAHGDRDSDDAPCFTGPDDLIPGCLGADLDFDGPSYLPDWPDGTSNHATSVAIRSMHGGGIGPISWSDEDGNYDQPFPIVHIESTVADSESSCLPDGVGCVVPPKPARFYPFYALLENGDDTSTCALVFGNVKGPGVNNFGRDAQYGASNLPWFFGQNSSGPRPNPCLPRGGL
jgi:hypothetical protein